MGFLIVSEGGDGLGIATRLQQEGHRVAMWIRDAEAEKRGEEIVEKSSYPDFSPVVLADCTGAGALCDIFVERGTPVFGGSQLQDKLESDREFSSEVFHLCGIKEPKSREFTDWEKAKELISLLKDDAKLVFKPNGKLSGVLPSYVSEDSEEMLRMLDHFKQTCGEETSFVLQEFIEGVCVSSEVWFDGFSFIESSFNHTLERKQLMNGDIGPSGGCTGNVVWKCDDSPEECPLCQNLLRLEGFLSTHRYKGPIDINTVVSNDGKIFALEFTPRFGYDAFPALLYGLWDGDFGSFIETMARAEESTGLSLPLRSGYAVGVRISVPPWPSEDFHAKSGLPLRGLRRSDGEKFYPYEVSLVDGESVTSGGYGIIGVSIGYEQSIEGAFEEAYSLCERLKLPDKQYRTDLIEVFQKDARRLARSLAEVSTR